MILTFGWKRVGFCGIKKNPMNLLVPILALIVLELIAVRAISLNGYIRYDFYPVTACIPDVDEISGEYYYYSQDTVIRSPKKEEGYELRVDKQWFPVSAAAQEKIKHNPKISKKMKVYLELNWTGWNIAEVA